MAAKGRLFGGSQGPEKYLKIAAVGILAVVSVFLGYTFLFGEEDLAKHCHLSGDNFRVVKVSLDRACYGGFVDKVNQTAALNSQSAI